MSNNTVVQLGSNTKFSDRGGPEDDIIAQIEINYVDNGYLINFTYLDGTVSTEVYQMKDAKEMLKKLTDLIPTK